MEYLQYALYFLLFLWAGILPYLAMMAGWHAWCKFRWDHLGWRPLFYDEKHLNEVAKAQGFKLFDSAMVEALTNGKSSDERAAIRAAFEASHREAIEEYVKTFANNFLTPKELEQ